MVKDCRDCEWCGVFPRFMARLSDIVICGYTIVTEGRAGGIDPKSAENCPCYHPIDARLERYNNFCEMLDKTAAEIDELTGGDSVRLLDTMAMLNKIKDMIKNEPREEADDINVQGINVFGFMRN